MIIGVPKEIKNNENRVALTPAGVIELVRHNHTVYIEKQAGIGSGFSDDDYKNAGARIIEHAKDIFDISDMIIKVKEPQPSEYNYFKEGQILFTYLHLAPYPKLTDSLLKNKIIGIAYETIELPDGSLPLLVPMSEVAGRMATQLGAQFLENHEGGKGVLLGGVPGVAPAEVVIIGGGIVGTNAAKMAIGLGASVTILDNNLNRLAEIDNIYNGRIKTVMSNQYNVEQAVKNADLLIGAVLIHGARAPKIVTEEMVRTMAKGSVIVDVAIDQGGAIETSNRVTTHDKPVYEKFGVLHYAVANMPGAVSRTSTIALTNATLKYIIELADKGYVKAFEENRALLKGLNLFKGKLTCKPVAENQNIDFYEYTTQKS